jgi:phage terminase large subunit-like protein
MSNLTRQQKIERIRLLEEKARREKEKRPIFKDRAHAQQLKVLASTEIERWVLAGNGSGKTATGAEDVRCAVTGQNPYNGLKTRTPVRAYIILDKPEKIDSVVLPELRKWMNISAEQCHKRGKPYVSEITFPNGSWIKFLFWDQDPMTAEGFEGDYFWFDEPPPRHLYIALKRAGRTKGRPARYLITCTLLRAAWIRQEVLEPWQNNERPNTACFEFETEMNRPNLRDGWIEEFSAILSEKEKLVRLKGKSFDLDGVALAHLFKRDKHLIDRDKLNQVWTKDNPCVIVMDPHPSKKHHAVLMGVDKDNYLYVLDECAEKQIARDFITTLIDKKQWFLNYRILDVVYDSLGSAETTSGEGFKPFGVVVNEVLAAYGLGRARATTYNEKEDEAFIERIRDVLRIPDEPNNFGQIIPKLRFVSDCKGSIGDVTNVQWARDSKTGNNKEKLDITNTDYLSCIKYALATNLYYKKNKDRAYYPAKPAYGFSLKPRKW